MISSSFTSVTIGTLLALAACTDPTTSAPPSSRNYSVTPYAGGVATIGWQARARALVSGASLNPLAAGRIYAALSVAQYQALVAADQFDASGVLPAGGLDDGGRSRYEAQRGAVAGASARVLSFFFPAASGTLEEQVTAEAGAGPGGEHPQFGSGLAAGRAVGDQMVQRVQTDGFTTPWTGTVPAGPGKWVANGPPAGATLGGVTPYFMTSGSQFRPAPPPAFESAEFNAALAEVNTLAQNRTPAQIANIIFWNSGPGTVTPPGYWNTIAETYSSEKGLSETATARVFAHVNAAMFDALIACWDAKYYYWYLRPSQANAAVSLALPLPNHPSFPSGHSCVSAAAATVLAHFFPDRATDVANAVQEAGLSRILAGIHYRFDITAGNAIGTAVGQLAISKGL